MSPNPASTPIRFRVATVADIATLSEIRLSVRENVLSNPGRVTLASYQEYLNEKGRGWLCEAGDTIAGFSVASRHDSSIWALFLREEFEGRGIGHALLTLAVHWLFRQGATRVSLTTDAGTRADSFYQRLGWRRAETSKADSAGKVHVTFCLGSLDAMSPVRQHIAANDSFVTCLQQLQAGSIEPPRD